MKMSELISLIEEAVEEAARMGSPCEGEGCDDEDDGEDVDGEGDEEDDEPVDEEWSDAAREAAKKARGLHRASGTATAQAHHANTQTRIGVSGGVMRGYQANQKLLRGQQGSGAVAGAVRGHQARSEKVAHMAAERKTWSEKRGRK